MTQPKGMQQNPLDQLKDIHLPDPISIWPLGLGWWLVLLIVLVTVALTVFFIRKNRWKRIAKAQVVSFPPTATAEYYYQINRTLKQICLQRFGQESAHLSGAAWLEYLDSKLKSPQFQTEIPEFADAPDNPSCCPDPNHVQRIALLWLKQHRVK